MTILRQRDFELQVDTLRIVGLSGMRVTFKASKTLKKEPNSCSVSIYNLSPESRAALVKAKTPSVLLRAGYEDEMVTVFQGQALHVSNERQGPDTITTISTSDEGDKAQRARIYQTFGAGAKTGDVLRALVKALGVKVGNLNQVAAQLNAGKAASMYAEGVTMHGHVATEIDALCRGAGLEWSIQEGQLQLLDIGAAFARFATVLTEDLLKTTPAVSSKGVVSAATFLQKDFLPGRQIQIRHEFVEGAYRLEKCDYRGDTRAEDWDVEFEAKAIGAK